MRKQVKISPTWAAIPQVKSDPAREDMARHPRNWLNTRVLSTLPSRYSW